MAQAGARRETAGAESLTKVDGDCCSCAFAATEIYTGSNEMPCDFDHPAGWEELFSDDGSAIYAITGKPPCGETCVAPSTITFMVAAKPNTNADTMEEAWKQIMPVGGTARCGGVAVTFFSPPGSEPDGLTGGVRFHIGHAGKKYGGTATFSCPEPGGWLALRSLFIDSFTTNPDTTFGDS